MPHMKTILITVLVGAALIAAPMPAQAAADKPPVHVQTPKERTPLPYCPPLVRK